MGEKIEKQNRNKAKMYVLSHFIQGCVSAIVFPPFGLGRQTCKGSFGYAVPANVCKLCGKGTSIRIGGVHTLCIYS